MNLEYYYLFGLDIPLERHSLGVIKQPKLIDFINEGVEVDSFYLPFIINDYMISQMENKDSVNNIVSKLGSLTFLLMNCYQTKRFDVLESLKKSIGMLYGYDVIITDKLNLMVGGVIIDNSNFDVLCDLVLEMLKIDKSKIKFDKKQKQMSAIELEFEKRKKEYLEKTNSNDKDKSMSILDLANVVSHSGVFSYIDVLNMTIYQLKNSFEVVSVKESFNTNTLYRVSPKFDTSKEKYEHWTEKIKISKSRLDDKV